MNLMEFIKNILFIILADPDRYRRALIEFSLFFFPFKLAIFFQREQYAKKSLN